MSSLIEMKCYGCAKWIKTYWFSPAFGYCLNCSFKMYNKATLNAEAEKLVKEVEN